MKLRYVPSLLLASSAFLGAVQAGVILTEGNYTRADVLVEDFLSTNSQFFDGGSLSIVGPEGLVHEYFVSPFTALTTILANSACELISTIVLMALGEDPSNDFSVVDPISSFLGPSDVDFWGNATVEQLLSNTADICGVLTSNAVTEEHMCQTMAGDTLSNCGEMIYDTPITDPDCGPPNTPGTEFNYGGSQWQLAGYVAENVTGMVWADIVKTYLGDITDPANQGCALSALEYANLNATVNGGGFDPDNIVSSLLGQANPSIGIGCAINAADYAKILQIVVAGECGPFDVVSSDVISFMRIDRGSSIGSTTSLLENVTSTTDDCRVIAGYGMGWWIIGPGLYVDVGGYGAVSWYDSRRKYAGYLGIANYTLSLVDDVLLDAWRFVIFELIPEVTALLDDTVGVAAA